MSDYVDLVLVKHDEVGQPYLFRAPKYSSLKRGDEVIVETKNGEQTGYVIDRITIDCDPKYGDEYMFIRRMNGMRELKRVLCKVEKKKFFYEEEEDGTDQSGE